MGEIILVVIGILIALNINNSNENAKKRRAERAFYLNIQKQLKDDALNISGQIEYNSYYAGQFEYAMQVIAKGDRSQKDSLSIMALNLSNYSDFDRQGNIYETMVNSGDVKLLRNAEIIERLRRLEETYLYVNRMENIHYDAMISIIPYLMQSISFGTGKAQNEEFIYSFELQNMFAISLRIMGEKEAVYRRALDEIASIQKLIEGELN